MKESKDPNIFFNNFSVQEFQFNFLFRLSRPGPSCFFSFGLSNTLVTISLKIKLKLSSFKKNSLVFVNRTDRTSLKTGKYIVALVYEYCLHEQDKSGRVNIFTTKFGIQAFEGTVHLCWFLKKAMDVTCI